MFWEHHFANMGGGGGQNCFKVPSIRPSGLNHYRICRLLLMLTGDTLSSIRLQINDREDELHH